MTGIASANTYLCVLVGYISNHERRSFVFDYWSEKKIGRVSCTLQRTRCIHGAYNIDYRIEKEELGW